MVAILPHKLGMFAGIAFYMIKTPHKHNNILH